jgi:hypothetical protein
MEADLSRYHRIDLRDLWRTDDDGNPRLTLRQVWARLRHLPRDSAFAILDNGGTEPWSISDHLAADLWLIHAQSNAPKNKRPKDHPRREKEQQKRVAGKASRKRGAFEKAKARNAKRLAGRT